MTLGFWSLRDWLKFWLGGATKIELKGNSLNLRADNYLAKIADLAMAWEVMVDNVYDAFPIQPEDTVVDIGGQFATVFFNRYIQIRGSTANKGKTRGHDCPIASE